MKTINFNQITYIGTFDVESKEQNRQEGEKKKKSDPVFKRLLCADWKKWCLSLLSIYSGEFLTGSLCEG